MRNQESAEQCLPIIMPQRRCGTPCHLTFCAMNWPETTVVRAQLLLQYVLWSFSLWATFPAVVALASFPPDCVHSPLALQWRNLQIYVARPQLNRLTSFEIQGARTTMESRAAYSAGVGGPRFRRQFWDLWISFIGLPSLYPSHDPFP